MDWLTDSVDTWGLLESGSTTIDAGSCLRLVDHELDEKRIQFIQQAVRMTPDDFVPS